MISEHPALPSTELRPIQFGGPIALTHIGSIGIALLALLATLTVVFEAPSPLRPLAVLLFLGIGPGLSVVGLFGIRDLTQRLVLSIGVSLALDTIVAGLSIYTGLWSPIGILMVLVVITIAGIALQLRVAPEQQGIQSPAQKAFDIHPGHLHADFASGDTPMSTPDIANHEDKARKLNASGLRNRPEFSNKLVDTTDSPRTGIGRSPVRLTMIVVLIGFIGGCIMLMTLGVRRALVL